jgi:hypothetical protein
MSKLGKAAALVMPWCDTHGMTQHLAEISRYITDGAHAILIMDHAGWHRDCSIASGKGMPRLADSVR